MKLSIAVLYLAVALSGCAAPLPEDEQETSTSESELSSCQGEGATYDTLGKLVLVPPTAAELTRARTLEGLWLRRSVTIPGLHTKHKLVVEEATDAWQNTGTFVRGYQWDGTANAYAPSNLFTVRGLLCRYDRSEGMFSAQHATFERLTEPTINGTVAKPAGSTSGSWRLGRQGDGYDVRPAQGAGWVYVRADNDNEWYILDGLRYGRLSEAARRRGGR